MDTIYKGHTIPRTATMTQKNERNGGGSYTQRDRNLYDIEGPHGKAHGTRPFITSIQAAKEHINDELEKEEME